MKNGKTIPSLEDYKKMLNDNNDTVYDRYSVLCSNLLTSKLRQRFCNEEFSDKKQENGYIDILNNQLLLNYGHIYQLM